MATEITAAALAGVHSQQDAINALKGLLQEATPGTISLADDATKAIEQFCPALARSIRNAVADWNQGLNSPFLTQLMAASGPSPESRTHHCVGLIFYRNLAKKITFHILKTINQPIRMVTQLGTSTYNALLTNS